LKQSGDAGASRITIPDWPGATATNISANSRSSSMLPVSARTLEIEPSAGYVGTQGVPVYRLDSLLDQFAKQDDRIYLKIDTQGYELKILIGALGVINRFALIQLEASFFEVYNGETMIGDMIKFLDYLGYRVVANRARLGKPYDRRIASGRLYFWPQMI
jgi:hypothetical protein